MLNTGKLVCFPVWVEFFFYRPQTKFAKVMFSQVSVCPQGEGVLECVTGETATAASGTHPTGMHSCSVMKILYTILDPVEFFTTRRH